MFGLYLSSSTEMAAAAPEPEYTEVITAAGPSQDNICLSMRTLSLSSSSVMSCIYRLGAIDKGSCALET